MPGYYSSFLQSAMHHRPIICNFSRGNYRFWEGVPILNNLWKEAAFVNIIRNFSSGNYRLWEGGPIRNSLWKEAAFVNIIRNFSSGNCRLWEGVPILNSLWKEAISPATSAVAITDSGRAFQSLIVCEKKLP